MHELFFRRGGYGLALALILGLIQTAVRAQEPPAQIAVSPARFEIQIDDLPTTESLTLFNYSDRPVAIGTSLASWDLDANNAVRILEPDEQSLDQWIVINPLRFVIPAGKSQTVRFSVRPRVRPLPGEHRAMIYFDQLLPGRDDTKTMRVKFRLGVAIYGQVGTVRRDGRLNAVKVVDGQSPVTARLDISNEGSSHVRLSGHYTIWPADLYPGATQLASFDPKPGDKLPEGALALGRLPNKPVLPGTRRDVVLSTATKLPPGAYVLDLNGSLGQSSIDRRIRFTVPYPARVSGPDPD